MVENVQNLQFTKEKLPEFFCLVFVEKTKQNKKYFSCLLFIFL